MSKPPRVQHMTDYWIEPPPELSERCVWWLQQIENGWRPNKRIGKMGYHTAAEWFGVYIYEYLHHVLPAMSRHTGR